MMDFLMCSILLFCCTMLWGFCAVLLYCMNRLKERVEYLEELEGIGYEDDGDF